MKNFEEEKAYIDGDYESFVQMYRENGLSLDGETYLAETRQQRKINFFLGVKPFAPKVQFDIIDMDNRTVLGMMALRYNLNPDPERHLRKAPQALRRVYYSKQRFRNEVEIDFVKTEDIKIVQSYVYFHGGRMCEKAVNICRDVRKIRV